MKETLTPVLGPVSLQVAGLPTLLLLFPTTDCYVLLRTCVLQAIDANQEGYLEEALKLTCALREFGIREPGASSGPVSPARSRIRLWHVCDVWHVCNIWHVCNVCNVCNVYHSRPLSNPRRTFR